MTLGTNTASAYQERIEIQGKLDQLHTQIHIRLHRKINNFLCANTDISELLYMRLTRRFEDRGWGGVSWHVR